MHAEKTFIGFSLFAPIPDEIGSAPPGIRDWRNKSAPHMNSGKIHGRYGRKTTITAMASVEQGVVFRPFVPWSNFQQKSEIGMHACKNS